MLTEIDSTNMPILSKALESAKQKWGDPFAYEQSYVYLRQAMRRGGWMFQGEDGFVCIARMNTPSGKNAMITPMTRSYHRFLPSAVKQCAAEGIAIASIRHVPINDAAHVKEAFGRISIPTQRHSSQEVLDDLSEDRFPQVGVEVLPSVWRPSAIADSVVDQEMIPSVFADFRYQVRRFRKRYPSTSSIRLISLRDATREECIGALDTWMLSLKRRIEFRGWPNVRDYERTFREPNAFLIEDACAGKIAPLGLLVKIDDVPRALWIGGEVSSRGFGVYVLFGDTEIFNVSYYILYTCLLWAKESGYERVLLGGSEAESLFRFKSLKAAEGGPESYIRFRELAEIEL